MHTVGLHSALAIKRQRKRREEMRKARERKYSSQSADSGAGASSSESLDRSRNAARRHQLKKPSVESNLVSPIGMLHVGIVFLVLGIFLIGSGLVPDDYTSWDQSISWWNELVCTGLVAIALGIFLITLNHYLAQHEEEELSAYVERQLTRSRSGRRLIKDEETGCLSTKNQKDLRRQEEFMAIESEVQHVPFSPTIRSPPSILISTPKSDLERILEEESERGDEDGQEIMQREIMANGKMHGNRSPGHTPELVVARHYYIDN